ncbi:hypothetical protein IPG41_02245 [Candidatus Peregrinibacteria bacterium]|nr:MAG: hypothetical protein IPG41_02245 [Candidatus Peregrinibacteria bacterium]
MKYPYVPAALSLAAILFGSSLLALILHTTFRGWNAFTLFVLGLVLFLSNAIFLFVMRSYKMDGWGSFYLLGKLKIVSFLLLLFGGVILCAGVALFISSR